MATLPSVPTFTFQEDPSIAVLNQLAAAVTFLNTNQALTLLTVAGSQTIATATDAAVQWAALGVPVNRDSGWASGTSTRYTSRTPGYYDMAAHVDFASNITGYRHAYFQVTTGANNPGGAGLTSVFSGVAVNADESTDTHVQISALSFYLYVLDYVEVYAYQTSGGALGISSASQWMITLDSLGP